MPHVRLKTQQSNANVAFKMSECRYENVKMTPVTSSKCHLDDFKQFIKAFFKCR